MIQKRKKTVEKGRPVETWEDYFKCWCDVKSLYGKELYEALEAKLENVLNFETRFCGKLSDSKLRETQKANYFSNLCSVDCAVLSVKAQSCRKYCAVLP